jgi:hypothetical protein
LEPKDPQGNAPPEGAQGTDDSPKFVTEDQLNKAITARFKGFEQKIEKTFGESLTAFGGKMKEELAALLPPKPEPKEPEKKKDAQAPSAPHPDLKRFEDQIAALTKQADDARTERDAERAKMRDATLRQRLTDALATAGIDGVRARHAVGLLVDAEKRVRWSDDGDAVLFRRAEDDDVELGEGLKHWLKTDDAKLYLPPRGATGSGDRPGAATPRAPNEPPTRGDVADGLRRALLGQL